MTGIAGLVDVVADPLGTVARLRLVIEAFLLKRRWRERKPTDPLERFIVLCWRRTGSNWLCGVLHGHPEILMHNELFNESDIHTYHRKDLVDGKWTYEQRDTHPGRFLRDMFHNVVDPRGLMRTVGFKSFPEHYWDHEKPNISLTRIFNRLLLNPAIKKVVLERRNMLAVYVSMVRSKVLSAYMVRDYSDVPIRIDILEFQRFIDRYQSQYKSYYTKSLRSGSPVHTICYEDMLESQERFDAETKSLWQFLGVDDGVIAKALKENVLQNKRDIRYAIENYDEVEFAFRHTSLAPYLGRIAPAEETATATPIPDPPQKDHRWGILLPICSRGDEADPEKCFSAIDGLFSTLVDTVPVKRERACLEVHFGIDGGDIVFDSPASEARLTTMAEKAGLGKSHFMVLHDLEGKICHIWNCLAQEAHRNGCEFLVLLGDDVRLKTAGWKKGIERRFWDIASKRQLPFGFACVAFNDVNFRNFPTFPVVHKEHLARCRRLFPRRLINQGGDPFLFELYKRWGASEFCFEHELENTIGGMDEARYTKRTIRWNGEQLTTYIDKLEGNDAAVNENQVEEKSSRPAALTDKGKRVPCVDVVVPTFRLDVEILSRIVSLRASVPANVSFWIVIDNPDAEPEKLNAVRAMEKLDNNYAVNIREHDKNYGVSAARNTGMAYSNADFICLLDDDVKPDPGLLDAYIGGIMRHPRANVLVGLAELSTAKTLWSKAMLACNVIGFYYIADDRPFPPWGVTANLCVRGRTSRIRFKHKFPNTGGGEDIDYCIRSNQFKGAIVSVPGASVEHPWWADGHASSIIHVMGWAKGESLCVDDPDLQQYIYWTLPNVAEWTLLSLVLAPFWHPRALLLASLAAALVQILLRTRSFYFRVSVHEGRWMKRCVIGFVGSLIVLCQEMARVAAHLDRMRFVNLLWRFDWYCKQQMSYRAAQKTAHLIVSIVYVSIFIFVY
mmetsp:Transcript_12999/g.30731  ORF Transcript_12999/g.30731 Transcript_12999/m.30731 type:complete len:955 (-) Transcript_12999:28-2892(-)